VIREDEEVRGAGVVYQITLNHDEGVPVYVIARSPATAIDTLLGANLFPSYPNFGVGSIVRVKRIDAELLVTYAGLA
jgi:hypothetical protein